MSPPDLAARSSPHWECFRLWLGFLDRDEAQPAIRWERTESGLLRLKDLAERACVSTSTLQRRLATDGGFRQTRERTLATSAIRWLQDTNDSIETIAADLVPGGAIDVAREQLTRVDTKGDRSLGFTFAVGPCDFALERERRHEVSV
ncbi:MULTISPECIES: hypothetical protein [unclassified Bradyrhizobium]|uniref:hypothetical protein n=1 Tax=unclassified Bradyrhizobium TaxID=2631580 RepID=UPI002812680C|nr:MULTISPECIES: hypothetical protein [unclassified Bradyrhizobium]